jgi:hypothetical protein
LKKLRERGTTRVIRGWRALESDEAEPDLSEREEGHVPLDGLCGVPFADELRLSSP